jgi:hypothetical protein
VLSVVSPRVLMGAVPIRPLDCHKVAALLQCSSRVHQLMMFAGMGPMAHLPADGHPSSQLLRRPLHYPSHFRRCALMAELADERRKHSMPCATLRPAEAPIVSKHWHDIKHKHWPLTHH